MRTHHVHSRNLVGLFFFAVLVVLYGGGCGKTVCTDHQALACPEADRCPVGSERMAGAGGEGMVTICDEPRADTDAVGGFMGYCDPASSDSMSTWAVAEEGCTSGPVGDVDEDRSDTVTAYIGGEEEGMRTNDEEYRPEMNEASGFVDHDDATYDEVPWTPAVTDQEGTPEQTGDIDDDSSDTAGPGIDEGNETTVDASSFGAISDDGLGNTVVDEAGWTWMNNVRLVASQWWQAIITIENDTDVPPYEGYIPSTPSDVEAGESGNDLTAGPPP